MTGQSAQARRRQQQNRQGILIFIAVTVFAAIALTVYAMNREPDLDKTNLCPATGPTGQVVLLVDKTDPLNFTQKQAFQRFLDDLAIRGVPEGNLLSVFMLGEDYTTTSEPLLELCNPGDGHDKSDLTHNPKQLMKHFQQRFRKPVVELADKLETTQPAKLSPIFEMIQLVAINGFRKHHVAGPKKLYIVSDMMHNTPQYSMYRGDFNFEAFLETPYGRKTTTDLKGVDVDLQYIINTPQLQTRRHAQFWEQYFSTVGAHLDAVHLLEG